MINKEEVQHIAKLARLGLNKKEIEEMRKDLSSILDYIEKLKEVDISGVDVYLSSDVENIMREDKEELKSKDEGLKLMELAPETQKGYLKTKQIL